MLPFCLLTKLGHQGKLEGHQDKHFLQKRDIKATVKNTDVNGYYIIITHSSIFK